MIAVDGLPAKTFRVGETVLGAVVLQSVRPHGASLGPTDGPAVVELELAPVDTLPTAATGHASAGVTREQAAIHAASAPPVDRSAVPVLDPEHGVDTSNH